MLHEPFKYRLGKILYIIKEDFDTSLLWNLLVKPVRHSKNIVQVPSAEYADKKLW